MDDNVTLRRSTRNSVVNKTDELTPRKVSTPVKVDPSTPSRRTRASSSTPKKSLIERISTPKKTLPVLNEEETPKKRATSNIKSINSTLTPKKKGKGENLIKDDSTKTSKRNVTASEKTEGLMKENISSFQNKTSDEIKNSSISGKILADIDRPLTRAKRKTLTQKQGLECTNVLDETEKSPQKMGKEILKSDGLSNKTSGPSETKCDSISEELSSFALAPRIVVTDYSKCGIKEANKAEGLGKNIDYDMSKVNGIFSSKSPTKVEDISIIGNSTKITENHGSASEASLKPDEEVLNITVDKNQGISTNTEDHIKLEHTTPNSSSNDIVLTSSLDSRTDNNETERNNQLLENIEGESLECESSHINVTEPSDEPDISHNSIESNTNIRGRQNSEENKHIDSERCVSSEDIEPSKSDIIDGPNNEIISNDGIRSFQVNIAESSICVSSETCDLKVSEAIEEISLNKSKEILCSPDQSIILEEKSVILEEISTNKETVFTDSDQTINNENVLSSKSEENLVVTEDSKESFVISKDSSVVLTNSVVENITSESKDLSCIQNAESVENLIVEGCTSETNNVSDFENNFCSQNIQVLSNKTIPNQLVLTDDKDNIKEVEESQYANVEKKIELMDTNDTNIENESVSPSRGSLSEHKMDVTKGDDNNLVKASENQVHEHDGINFKNTSSNDVKNELDISLAERINKDTSDTINNIKTSMEVSHKLNTAQELEESRKNVLEVEKESTPEEHLNAQNAEIVKSHDIDKTPLNTTEEMLNIKNKTGQGKGSASSDLKTIEDNQLFSETSNILPAKTDGLDDIIMSPKDFLNSDEESAMDDEKLDDDKNIPSNGSSSAELEIKNISPGKKTSLSPVINSHTQEERESVNPNYKYENDKEIKTVTNSSTIENNSLHENKEIDTLNESGMNKSSSSLKDLNTSRKSINNLEIIQSNVSNNCSTSQIKDSNFFDNELSDEKLISCSKSCSKESNYELETVNVIKNDRIGTDQKNSISKQNNFTHDNEIGDVNEVKNSNPTTENESIKSDNINKRLSLKNSPLKQDKLKDLFENEKNVYEADSNQQISGKDFIEFEAEVGEELLIDESGYSEETSSSSESSLVGFFSLEAKENSKKRLSKVEDSDSSDNLESVSVLFQSPKNVFIESGTSKLSKNKKQKIEHIDFTKRKQKLNHVDSKKMEKVSSTKNLAFKEFTNAGVFAVSGISNISQPINKFTVTKIDFKQNFIAAPKGFVVTQVKKSNSVKEKTLASLKRRNRSVKSKKSSLKANGNKSLENVLKPQGNETSSSPFSVSLILPTSCTSESIQTTLTEMGINNVSSICLIKPKVAVVEFSSADSYKKVLDFYGELKINDQPVYVIDNSS